MTHDQSDYYLEQKTYRIHNQGLSGLPKRAVVMVTATPVHLADIGSTLIERCAPIPNLYLVRRAMHRQDLLTCSHGEAREEQVMKR